VIALLTACSSDNAAVDTLPGVGGDTTSNTQADTSAVVEPIEAPTTQVVIDAARCEANRAAGTITFLTGFDYAAASSIVDVVVADELGFFDAYCLDVEVVSSFSTANYPLVASDEAQFASGGSYIELLNNRAEGADLQAVVLYGRTAIEGLVVPKDKGIASLADLEGKTIGIKGAMPPSMVAMLKAAGLEAGTDYTEQLLDGFDPLAHLDTGIDALPVFRSNEPGQLDRAGRAYDIYTPDDLPGSFGLIFTSAAFAAEHPTAVEDFVKADLAGWAAAVADPDRAVKIAVDRITAAGNPNFLSTEGEGYRFTTEAGIVAGATPAGVGEGVIDPAQLDAQIAAYIEAGVLPAGTTSAGTFIAEPGAQAYGPDAKLVDQLG
jgi:ABC-type nitrate/sulfonate/bicarbonate transport system substrate-binding protein